MIVRSGFGSREHIWRPALYPTLTKSGSAIPCGASVCPLSGNFSTGASLAILPSDGHQRAEAVMLDLVNPVGARRWLGRKHGKLGRNERRQLGWVWHGVQIGDRPARVESIHNARSRNIVEPINIQSWKNLVLSMGGTPWYWPGLVPLLRALLLDGPMGHLPQPAYSFLVSVSGGVTLCKALSSSPDFWRHK
jgi:hypothetical protein